MGAFITLEPPIREMRIEAAAAGGYSSPGWGRNYSRLQLLMIAQLLGGTAALQMPPTTGPFKAA